MEQSASIKIVYGRQSHCILKNLDALQQQHYFLGKKFFFLSDLSFV